MLEEETQPCRAPGSGVAFSFEEVREPFANEGAAF